LLVKDLTDRKHPFLYVDDLGTKARAVMRNRGLRLLPIVDEKGKLVGLVDREDIARALL
jgi:CBS domain-containing protein